MTEQHLQHVHEPTPSCLQHNDRPMNHCRIPREGVAGASSRSTAARSHSHDSGSLPLRIATCLFAGIFVSMAAQWHQATAADQKPIAAQTIREIFVPLDQLPVILGGENERVFMTRDEYRELQKLARKQTPAKSPVPAVLLSALYDATVRENIAVFVGKLAVEVLEPGLHSIELSMGGVQLRSARLDDSDAPVARNEHGRAVLFVTGVGRHSLELEMHAPVSIAAAQQNMTFELPHAGSVSLRFSVPGNVEVKSGINVVTRLYDEPKDRTEFILAPKRGPTSLVMSLNNRRLSQDQVIVARSVIVSELTTTSERLHATVSLDVLHGACDNFLFEVPNSFQVTQVASPLLAQWAVRQEAEQQILEVRIREATRGTEVLSIAATGPPTTIDDWSMPQLKPLNVTGSVAVVGVLAESHLRPLQMTPKGLIPIDVVVLRNALPESFFTTDPGAPQVRPIAAYYAPEGSFSLNGRFEDPSDELHVVTHLLLSLDDEQQTMRGGFTLIPKAMKRKSFSFHIPASWQLDKVHLQDGKPLECDQYRLDQERRCVVTLPNAIEPGANVTVYFEASYRSSAWLDHWDSVEIAFPTVRVEHATVSTGAIAVQANGDLLARPSTTDGLVPLDSSQRNRFGLNESSTELTFRFADDDYLANFRIERIQPVISSRNYSFVQISNGSIAAHYEVIYTIRRAHARLLQLALPTSTPKNLAIRGLDGVQLKEFSLDATADANCWNVLLAEAHIGQVRLAIDFEQPLEDPEPKDFSLPVIRTRGSVYQTQMVSIEGDASLDISITTKMRPIDVGELVEAEYTPGQRLLGTFASTDGTASLQVDVGLRDLEPLPAAVVEFAELVTQLSVSGVSQTAVAYRLRTKAPFLAVELPRDAELWSTTLNGEPLKPRRRGKHILLSIQSDQPRNFVDLQIAYQTPGQSIGWFGQVGMQAPRLSLVADDDDPGTPVPNVDLVWRVFVPTGYRISHTSGNVFPETELQQTWPALTLAQSSVAMAGGVHGWQTVKAARMVALASRSAAEFQMDMEYGTDMAEATDEAIVIREQAIQDFARMPQSAAPATPQILAEPKAESGVDYEAMGESPKDAPVADKRPDSGPSVVFGLTAADPFSDKRNVPAKPTPMRRRGGQAGMMGSGGMMSGMGGMGGMTGSGMGGGMMGGSGSGIGSGGMMGGMDGMMGGTVRDMNGNMDTLDGVLARDRGEVVSDDVRAPGSAVNQLLNGRAIADQKVAAVKAAKISKYWALQGLRGLAIQIDPSGSEQVFRSLGADPTLEFTIFHEQRMDWFSWAVAMAIALGGLMLIHSSVAKRFMYVATTVLWATGLPLFGGPFAELTAVCEAALFAAILLIPFWIVLAFADMIRRFIGKWTRRIVTAVTAGLVLIGLCLTADPTFAQAEDLAKILGPFIEQTKPVKIPDDAVVIPYDADDLEGRHGAEKVLVPYQRYVELWNLAHDDAKIGPQAAGQRFSLAGARYDVSLGDEEHLILNGTLVIELFTDDQVEVPLALHGAMVTRAVLDNAPAPLKAIQPKPAPAAQKKSKKKSQAAQIESQQQAKATSSLLALVVQGRGRHQLDLTVRVAVTRHGGWRQVSAVIPHAEATAIEMTVPQAESQIRRSIQNNSFMETTVEDGQKIKSVLETGGRFDVAWRSKISPGSVDQSLTAKSTGIIDLREDGIHVIWRIDFEFGQTERGVFEVSIPTDYLVESVHGKNVRGWDLTKQTDGHDLNIELLKSVKSHEQVTIHLSRRSPMAFATAQRVPIPYVNVPNAALNHGTLLIRRSPILEVKTAKSTGVARTDSESITKEMQTVLGTQKSPLGIRDYQAFRFNSLPFRIDMELSRIQNVIDAELRTLLRIGETESTLECEIRMTVQRGTLYHVRLNIPHGLKLEQVLCRDLSDWSVAPALRNGDKKPQANTKTLNIFLSAGQEDDFSISIQGRFDEHASNAAIPIPRLQVLDVKEQHGTCVFQIDTSLDAKLVDLSGCQAVLMDRAASWLTPEQRPLARLAIEYRGPEYGGKVALTPGRSHVSCNSFTNVRLTFREIQETVLLDFHISGAGVRRFQFRLPASLKDAQINAPMIREKSVTPVVADGAEDPSNKEQELVQVTLELQDAVTGQYRVVIENDRAIQASKQIAPLPLIDTGSTRNRYLTLENNGRDEVLVESVRDMEQVKRDSRQWQLLSTRLRGGDFTTAYVAKQPSTAAEFVYRTERRELVKTAGATIGLARTTLVLDQNGVYRASMLLKVDNRTEPYLEIKLPDGAELWTAHVANQPVKPARTAPPTNPERLRIPLVKTAEGDLDYSVVLKYGGRVNDFGTFTPVQFPFIRTVNVNIQQSQVKLLLPKALRWYQFAGTATREKGEDDLAAGYVAYRTRQVEDLTQILSGKNDFSKARASWNVDTLRSELEGLKQSFGDGLLSNPTLQQNLDMNARAFESAAAQIEQLEERDAPTIGNRGRLNTLFEQQSNTLSRNYVTKLGSNFPVTLPKQSADTGQSTRRRNRDFDRSWFFDNGLALDDDKAQPEAQQPPSQKQERQSIVKGKKTRQQHRYDDSSVQSQTQSSLPAPATDNAAQNVFENQRQAGKKRGDSSRKSVAKAVDSSQSMETQSELTRAYRQKRKQKQQAGVGYGFFSYFGSGAGVEQLGRAVAGQFPSSSLAQGQPADQGRAALGVAETKTATGWSSLDFDLPNRGGTFYFSTPGGDIEITARPVNRQLLERALRFGGLLAIAAFLFLILSISRRVSASPLSLAVAAAAMCLVGFFLTVLLIIPLAGLVLAMSGILVASEAYKRRESGAM